MTEVSKDAMSGFNKGQVIDRISNRFNKFLSSGRNFFEQSYSTAYQYSFDEGLHLLLRYLYSKDNHNIYDALAKVFFEVGYKFRRFLGVCLISLIVTYA